MSLFSYFWDSEVHLHNSTFAVEVLGCAAEIIIAVVAVVTLPKEWTKQTKKKVREKMEVFGLIAALICLVVVICDRRLSFLDEVEREKTDSAMLTLSNKLEHAQSDLADISKMSSPRKWEPSKSIESLRQFAGVNVAIVHNGERESTGLSEMISFNLSLAGWKTKKPPFFVPYLPYGLDVSVNRTLRGYAGEGQYVGGEHWPIHADTNVNNAASALVSELQRAGLQAELRDIGLFPTGWVVVRVGDNPYPAFRPKAQPPYSDHRAFDWPETQP